MASKTFDIDTVLSVATGYFVCGGFGKVYDLMGYMTGSEYITTVELLIAKKTCSAALCLKWPFLNMAKDYFDEQKMDQTNWESILVDAKRILSFPELMEVEEDILKKWWNKGDKDASSGGSGT